MISVGDAVLKITGDSADLDKELKSVDSKVKGMSDGMAKNMKIAGAAMTGMGVAITGALTMAVKAAAEEDVGIQRLAVSMKNVGLVYEGADSSLEKWIDSMQQSTAFADDEMREALSGLIILTEDMAEAQDLLTLSMDLARWKNIDLGTAADIVTKVYAGNMGTLSRYGIIVKEGATATEALAEIQKAAAGQAETYGKTVAGQMELLKNNMGDVSEAIGGALIPIIADLMKNIMPLIQNIKAWIAEHPGLTKVIVIVAAAVGGLMLVLGPLLMILPGIIAALPILGVAFTVLTGPVGLIIAAIVALIAIGVLLYKNWDTISAKAKEIWEGIKNLFSNIWQGITGIFQQNWDKILAILFPPIGVPMLIARHWEEIVTTVASIWERVIAFFSQVPYRIGQAFSTIKDIMLSPFRAAVQGIENAINWIISMLNSISFTVPDWVPLIGGRTFGIHIAPVNLPSFEGYEGIIPGIPGTPMPAIVHAGEYIGQDRGGNTVNIYNPSVRSDRDITELTRQVSREMYRIQQVRHG